MEILGLGFLQACTQEGGREREHLMGSGRSRGKVLPAESSSGPVGNPGVGARGQASGASSQA